MESRVCSGGIKERAGQGRRTGWGFRGEAQMREDIGNDRGIFDGGNERDRAATMGTGGHVDLEEAFEQLGPAQAGSPVYFTN